MADEVYEEEWKLPKTTVDKLIVESSMGHNISKDGRALIMDIALEFIHIITADANSICENTKRKTITHEHIFMSLERNGFKEYIDKCTDVYNEYNSMSKKRPSKQDKFKDSGLTMEELHKNQLKLFEDARKKLEKGDEETEEI